MDFLKSFSQKTKEGLCKIDFGSLCCCEAEMMGIIMFAGRFKGSEIRVSLENAQAIKRFAELTRVCVGVSTEVHTLKNSYYSTLNDKRILTMIVEYETAKNGFAEIVAREECCRDAFLRGAFLGGGSIVDPNKNYNMEFATYSRQIAEGFKTLLDDMGLMFRVHKKRSSYVLYTKNSDTVCDALAHMGAFSSQMEVLNVKIEREVRNDITRTSNGETANMDKVITAAIKQIRAIEKIEKVLGIDNLEEELREVAILRRDNKDLSLDQLGKKLNPPLSKSGVNHRIKKILAIAEEL